MEKASTPVIVVAAPVKPTVAMVTAVLRAAEYPLRVQDIVRKIAESTGAVVTAPEVNKLLYGKGPFEKVPGAGTPVWRASKAVISHPRPENMHTFWVDGVAVVSLPVDAPADRVGALLAALRAMGAGTFRAEATPQGDLLLKQAQDAGFTVGESVKLAGDA